MSNITAYNPTQLEEFEEIGTIIWYAVVGICGLIGNTFVIAVTWTRSRLNSSHLVIIWLGCTDMIGCLYLPIRYIVFYQNMTVSHTWCHVGFWMIPFVFFLNVNSLGMVAIERHKAVQNVNNSEHFSGKTVLALAVLCVLASFLYTTPIIWFLVADKTRCSDLDSSLDIHVNPHYIRIIIPIILCILSTFILITVLYIKICILVRTRVSHQPNPMQQFPAKNISSEFVEPAEDKTERGFNRWTNGLTSLHQVKDGDEDYNQGVSDDAVSCQFVDLQLIEEIPDSSQYSINTTSTRPSIYMISGASPILGPSQSESISSCECHFPGPSRHHLPGTVMDEHDIGKLCHHSGPSMHQLPCTAMDEHDVERQCQLPKVHSTTLQDGDIGNDEPIIPVLNDNQYQLNFMITRRVTSMLFSVTLVFFVTYVVSCTTLFIPYGVVRRCFREFVLINYIINPVIYSIANQGFREHCINFVQRIREKFN